MNHKELGDDGETIATYFLKKLGMEIIERNFSCKMGEIDIIAKDGDELVFVEVKTRSQREYGAPADAVNKQKRFHIYHVAEFFLMMQHLDNVFCRIDVVEVYYHHDTYSVNYIKNAVLDRPRVHKKTEESDYENDNEG